MSIRNRPESQRFFRKNIIEFPSADAEKIQSVYHAIGLRESQSKKALKETQKLKIKQPESSVDNKENNSHLSQL